MKNKIILFLSCFLIIIFNIYSQNVSIGTSTPHISAKLDVTSTNSGFLPPRMTIVQRNAIANPTPGLMIFNTSTQSLDVFTTYGWLIVKASFPVFNKLLGGTETETNPRIQQTADQGFIFAATSNSSATGDVSGNLHGGFDYWIVKLNSFGIIEWNKLLGGNLNEFPTAIQQTNDGGYIIAGRSNSSANGDVTGINHGGDDYWIVKLDGSGNILWNKLLGGNGGDVADEIQQTNDGGYIIAGKSNSSANGDVTGINHGGDDYWIVKLDGSGNILWNKLIGGNNGDIALGIQQTSDGGYIINGYTFSSANGDVSGTNHGGKDCWIVKINGTGVIMWNKLLGGNMEDEFRSIQQTTDGGYILAGITFSSANGDVTGTSHGGIDCWVVKLDASGIIVMNKLFGGNQNDLGQSIRQTSDGGYIMASASASSANGDVTASNHGPFDYWIVKLDGIGNIQWNKLIGGNQSEPPFSIRQKTDGGYVISGYSLSSANGDVTGTNHGIGTSDIWIITLTAAGNLSD